MASFLTIEKSTEGLYKEKGSRFLAYAYPVDSEEQIQKCLSTLRKTHFDARHHCYAWRIGMKNQRYRANDDGEPNHSAGDPILGQIRSFELTNVLVVVVRYFGGTKLGVGGLIQAYKTAAEEALLQVKKVEIFERSLFSIRFTYEQTSLVERILNDFEIDYRERSYEEDCLITGTIREESFAGLQARLREQGLGIS